mmetsp:Transcript_50421/g.109289  ORF Transcript_50421/g.109289 Transcript_50421/m.109289 type:complete len:206 (-) Transcript_50421:444-1061(-)
MEERHRERERKGRGEREDGTGMAEEQKERGDETGSDSRRNGSEEAKRRKRTARTSKSVRTFGFLEQAKRCQRSFRFFLGAGASSNRRSLRTTPLRTVETHIASHCATASPPTEQTAKCRRLAVSLLLGGLLAPCRLRRLALRRRLARVFSLARVLRSDGGAILGNPLRQLAHLLAVLDEEHAVRQAARNLCNADALERFDLVWPR